MSSLPAPFNEQRKFVVDAKLQPLGYQQITVLTSAVGLTPPPLARVAVVQPVTQAVRWRDDGTDPTATIGMLIAAGVERVYTGDLASVKFIEASATAELNISYYR